MIGQAIIFIGCWSLCFLTESKAANTGLKPSILASFENPIKKCGIETLLFYQKMFHIDDVDDDDVVEYDDLVYEIQRSDSNNDGIWTYEEALTDVDYENVTEEHFLSYDHNGDGHISSRDAWLVFELLPGTGNYLNFEDFLIIQATREDKSQGPEIDIKAFVHAVKDFRIIDMDDDFILTRKEFRMRFKSADRNKDGQLTGSEIRNLFPMRSTPPPNICGNWNVGCSQDDAMALFDSADTENRSQLSVDEYIRHFGPLVKI
ncbi:hypothetical protein LOTGIDRAFT_172944 [Lottia gigantea]|uniref:EF-hand domain-containing protein n=2 Tax=Lottia gigantea TaxID=225164 RepID=V4AUF3_LOTGI|nr:hypothetical protein LOTGIDRAFT_172944 [Lottia gigantea]ESP00938.1 hypothetical protein LOTGIDRAFT_172944 [Lottia gigantea]